MQEHFSEETLHSFHQFLKGVCDPKDIKNAGFRNYTPPGGSDEHLQDKVQVSFCSGSLELSWNLATVGS